MIFCCCAQEHVDILQAYSPAFLHCRQCFRKFLPFLYSLAWPPFKISCCCCLALFVSAYLGPRHTWHLFHYILKQTEKYFQMHQAILLRVNGNTYHTKDNTIEKKRSHSYFLWCLVLWFNADHTMNAQLCFYIRLSHLWRCQLCMPQLMSHSDCHIVTILWKKETCIQAMSSYIHNRRQASKP